MGEQGSKEFYDNLRRFKYEVDYPEIFDYVPFTAWAGKSVLEIGCGLGCDTLTWLEAGADLTSVDFTQVAVDSTRKHVGFHDRDFTPQRADARQLPFEANQFDCAYSWGVMMHTGGTQQCIDEALRVMKPDATFYGMFYNKNSLLYRFYVQLLGRQFDEGAPITEFYTNAELRRMFAAYEIEEVTNYYFLRPNVSRLGKYIPKPIERLLGSLFGACTYVRAKKPL